jgi:hypothetical protein
MGGSKRVVRILLVRVPIFVSGRWCFYVLLLAVSTCLRGWSGCRSKGTAERVLRGKAKLGSDGRTGGLLSGGKANGTMLLKLDQGSLHFDIHIGRKLLADLIGGKGAGLNVFVPPGLEGQFQISAKLATHVRLRFSVIPAVA